MTGKRRRRFTLAGSKETGAEAKQFTDMGICCPEDEGP
jgi:hypothetical protein